MGGALRVLLVDNSTADAARILRELERGGLRVHGQRVATPQDLRKALAEHTWDLVLAEYRLPAFDALTALELLHEAGLDLPFLVVAAGDGEGTAVAALKGGAHDFVRKDNLDRLVPAVEACLREAQLRRERAQGEDSLNTSNYRMKIILDSLVEGVAQYDRTGHIREANASARRILPEADLAELERASLGEDGNPWPAGSHPVTQALKRGLPCTGLTLGIRKGGAPPVWVSLNATPLLYHSREPWGVVVSFTDITEQRQVQRRRELVADLLQMAHQATSYGQLRADVCSRLALWAGCADAAIRLEDGAASAAPGCLSLPLNLGPEHPAVLRFLEPRSAHLIDLPPGALDEVAGILANILAKALAEQSLRERAEALARSRASLAQAQALAGLGVWELDLATQERRWSPETYTHWDCDPAQPVPSTEQLKARVHPEDQAAFQDFHDQLASAAFPVELEYRVITRAGATRHLFSQAIPLGGAEEPPGRFQGATLDITNRKLSELTLRDMDKLTVKGQMAAYIAHEINNPLAGIRNAFLLLEGAIPTEHPHRSYVPLINREIDRIASIIRTMYHLYRPDPGATKLVVMTEVFHDLESLLAPKCRAYATRIAFDSAGMAQAGSLNEGFFRQVLFNLILNAVEASPAGGVVTVQARSGKEHLEVSVADEGPGIPPEIQERMFQAGFTTKVDKEISGLGLGLATCRSLVESLGGTLAFQSRQPDQGTVFTVRLPFHSPR